MKKIKLTLLFGAILCIIGSCRKDSVPFDSNAFFFSQSKNELVIWATTNLKTLNQKENFAQKIASQYGKPDWELADAFYAYGGMPTVVVPFADKENKKINTIWLIVYENKQMKTQIINKDDIDDIKPSKAPYANADSYAHMFRYLENKIFNVGIKRAGSALKVLQSTKGISTGKKEISSYVAVETCTDWYQYGSIDGEIIDGTLQYNYTTCKTDWIWVPDNNTPTTPPADTNPPPSGGGGESSMGSASNTPEITVNIDKPCVQNAVNNLLVSSKGLTTKMAEILNNFMSDKNFIKISVIGGSTPNGAPGSLTHYDYNPNNRVYSATIQLNTDNCFSNSSEEYVASVLIHEITHAYIGYMNSNGSSRNLTSNTHDFMAENYINPIAGFLKDIYGITDAQAVAVAWSGVIDSRAYIDSSSFAYGSLGETMTKTDLQNIFRDFIIGRNGKPICTD